MIKRLLTIFSAFVLGSGSAFGVASCTARTKHDIEDNKPNVNQNFKILNEIKAEINDYLTAWWKTKAEININDYSDQTVLEELEDIIKTKDDGFSLTSEKMLKYRLLKQLFVAFKAEFDNLNQSLRDRYSNYYVDTMPGLLIDNLIDNQVTLYYIDSKNLAKFLNNTPEELKEITVKFNINYEVRFKQLWTSNTITSLVVITNDLDVLIKVDENIEKYFVNFIDNIFKKLNYKKIIKDKYFNDIDVLNILRVIISEELKKSRISFCSVLDIYGPQTKNVFHIDETFHKWQSVLKWAGEAYNSEQLTVENFLKFYKEKYITNKIFEDDNYYVKANITYFIPNHFMIENIPLQNKDNKITLENNIKILVSKE